MLASWRGGQGHGASKAKQDSRGGGGAREAEQSFVFWGGGGGRCKRGGEGRPTLARSVCGASPHHGSPSGQASLGESTGRKTSPSIFSEISRSKTRILGPVQRALSLKVRNPQVPPSIVAVGDPKYGSSAAGCCQKAERSRLADAREAVAWKLASCRGASKRTREALTRMPPARQWLQNLCSKRADLCEPPAEPSARGPLRASLEKAGSQEAASTEIMAARHRSAESDSQPEDCGLGLRVLCSARAGWEADEWRPLASSETALPVPAVGDAADAV